MLGVLILQFDTFGLIHVPVLNENIAEPASDSPVENAAATNRARRERMLKEHRQERRAARSSMTASQPYLVLEIDNPPNSKAIAEELQTMSGSGYSPVAVLPIVGGEGSHKRSARLSRGPGSRDRPAETRIIGVTLTGKRDRK